VSILGHMDSVVLPFERHDVGKGYASCGAVETRQATPEECEKYGIKVVSDLSRRVFNDLNLNWNPMSEKKAERLWGEGLSIPDIAAKLKRDRWETFLLILHLLRDGRIADRGENWVEAN